MSNEQDKSKHNTRMHRAWRAIKKQLSIIKSKKTFQGASKQIDEAQPHRLAKKHAMDCGTPGCKICGNPRRTRRHKHKDQLTTQERRNNQKVRDGGDD
jgi:hypothetical protein